VITNDAYKVTTQQAKDGRALLVVEDCETGNRIAPRLDREATASLIDGLKQTMQPETVEARDLRAGDLIDLGDGWLEVQMVWVGRVGSRWMVQLDTDAGCFDLPEEEEVTRR
jgi:hypothetical protein